jgi:hypothetical protein
MEKHNYNYGRLEKKKRQREYLYLEKIIRGMCAILDISYRGIPYFGRAIAEAVSRRLPTAAARVQNRVWSCGIL